MRCFIVSLHLFIFLTTSFSQNFWTKSGFEDNEVRFLTTGPDSAIYAHVILSGIGTTIYRSTDRGNSWVEINDGLPDQYYIHSIKSDSVNSVYLATGSYLYRIHSGDTTWKMVSMGSGTPIYSVVCNSHGLVLFGTSISYIFRSSDYGESWRLTYYDRNYSTRSMVISISGNIIASFSRFRSSPLFIRSTDGGLNWTTISGYNTHMNQLIVNPVSGYILGYSDWEDLMRSTDEGDTWTFRAHPFKGEAITSMIFDGSGKLYACGNSGVFTSTDEGLKWSNITYNLPSPAFGRSLALVLDGYLYVGTLLWGIWKTVERVTHIEEEYLSNSPKEFALMQNYPNPFNPSTQITFSVPNATYVTLKVYDILGREIAVLVNERKHQGEYNITWNAEGVPGGIYFYRIVAGDFIETKKMVLMK